MIEWFESIWTWIVQNKQNIIACVTSVDFIATVGAVVALINSIRASKKNTLSVDSMKEAIGENQALKSSVEVIDKSITSISGDVQSCKTDVLICNERVSEVNSSLQDLVLTMESKFNSLLEVQSLVYSTIKDDSLRSAVQSVIHSAKYNDSNTKVKITEDVNMAKKELEAKVAEVAAIVNKAKEELFTDTAGSEKTKTYPNNGKVTRY